MSDPSFGAAFRALRTRRGWSIPRLATALGISTAELSRVENGHLLPWPGSKIDAACVTMNCPDKAEGLKQTALMETGIKKGWISRGAEKEPAAEDPGVDP